MESEGRMPRCLAAVHAGSKVLEVWVKERRYIVCLNEEERRKDAHDRKAVVARLKEQLRSGAKQRSRCWPATLSGKRHGPHGPDRAPAAEIFFSAKFSLPKKRNSPNPAVIFDGQLKTRHGSRHQASSLTPFRFWPTQRRSSVRSTRSAR